MGPEHGGRAVLDHPAIDTAATGATEEFEDVAPLGEVIKG